MCGTGVGKTIFANLGLVVGSVLLGLALLEIVLRFMPVDDGLLAEPVSANDPVFRFQPNQNLIWSRGATFDLVNDIHVNNAGFVNDQDYDVNDGRRLVAVVGDSQIEAAMVPYANTLHGKMAESIPERVYSFAASGAPLSQYVIWAQYARRYWGANFLVVVVLGNDFDESLKEFNTRPGFHYYSENDDGTLELERVDYNPNRFRFLVRASALVRYLIFNGQILSRLKRVAGLQMSSAVASEIEFSGNTSFSADDRRLALSQRVVGAFLRDLQLVGGWPPENVILVVDGFRYPAHWRIQKDSYFGRMRRYLIREARSRDFGVIDMDTEFFPDHNSFGRALDFPNDGHWNERAHGLAAKAVLSHSTFKQWMATK